MQSSSSAYSLILFAVLASTPIPIFAAIDLIPKEVTLEMGATSVRVINRGNRPEYVDISLLRLLNPGEPLDKERLERIGEAMQPSLYAFPFRMTLAPSQTKTITLKPLRPVETETVYRLDVKPVIKVLGAEQKTTSANVVVSLGFSGLVRQLPTKERDGLSVACDAAGARLTATGTVRHKVVGANVDGRDSDDFNVYPGVPLFIVGRVVKIPGFPVCEGGSEK